MNIFGFFFTPQVNIFLVFHTKGDYFEFFSPHRSIFGGDDNENDDDSFKDDADDDETNNDNYNDTGAMITGTMMINIKM